jgi:ferredoxin
VESRAFASFVQDPSRGPDLASSFTLAGSPQVERAWPEHALSYEDEQGQEVCEEVPFTCVDFLALDPKHESHFTAIPRSQWNDTMVALGDYLAQPAAEASPRVPYLLMTDPDHRLHRVVVGHALIAYARSGAARWRRLQELAGIDNSHAVRLVAEERARLESELQRSLEERPAVDTPPAAPEAVPETPAQAEAEPAPSPAAEEPAASRDDAYIDTELCTSCDDCTARNPLIFAYNEAKQAYIKDAAAGSYRDLVEAAEECPVCIIHPGKPLDPNEVGIDELMKRAEGFA